MSLPLVAEGYAGEPGAMITISKQDRHLWDHKACQSVFAAIVKDGQGHAGWNASREEQQKETQEERRREPAPLEQREQQLAREHERLQGSPSLDHPAEVPGGRATHFLRGVHCYTKRNFRRAARLHTRFIRREHERLRAAGAAATPEARAALLRRHPTDGHGDLFVFRAAARRLSGDVRGAMDDLYMATIQDPSNAVAFHRRGLLHKEMRQWRAALHDLAQGVELCAANSNTYDDSGADTRLVEAFVARGQIFMELERWDDAVASFGRAVELLEEQLGASGDGSVVSGSDAAVALTGALLGAARAYMARRSWMPAEMLLTRLVDLPLVVGAAEHDGAAAITDPVPGAKPVPVPGIETRANLEAGAATGGEARAETGAQAEEEAGTQADGEARAQPRLDLDIGEEADVGVALLERGRCRRERRRHSEALDDFRAAREDAQRGAAWAQAALEQRGIDARRRRALRRRVDELGARAQECARAEQECQRDYAKLQCELEEAPGTGSARKAASATALAAPGTDEEEGDAVVEFFTWLIASGGRGLTACEAWTCAERLVAQGVFTRRQLRGVGRAELQLAGVPEFRQQRLLLAAAEEWLRTGGVHSAG